MELFQFVSYLRQFNADVLLIGAAVWALTAVLKRTLLKNVKRKYMTFVPFVLGILLYAAFTALTGGFDAGVSALAPMFAKGVACGSLATVIHVVYEQFLRGNGGLSLKAQCVKALLADCGEIADADAEAIAAAVGTDEEGAMQKIAKIAGEELAPALYSLIETTLRTLYCTVPEAGARGLSPRAFFYFPQTFCKRFSPRRQTARRSRFWRMNGSFLHKLAMWKK